MDNFLDRIDGLSSENLTTEVLGFLLDSSTYAPYQRLFYSLIFPGSELQDTEERQFDVTTQMSFEEYGRPDIVIENERQVIFIENKFYASFSLDNQMYRYYSDMEVHVNPPLVTVVFAFPINQLHYNTQLSIVN
jgi:hypothetical protein